MLSLSHEYSLNSWLSFVEQHQVCLRTTANSSWNIINSSTFRNQAYTPTRNLFADTFIEAEFLSPFTLLLEESSLRLQLSWKSQHLQNPTVGNNKSFHFSTVTSSLVIMSCHVKSYYYVNDHLMINVAH